MEKKKKDKTITWRNELKVKIRVVEALINGGGGGDF